MPQLAEYYAPISPIASDNKSWTTKSLLILKDCTLATTPNGCEGGWNDTLCGNDEYYSQPFVRGDVIRFQFHFDKKIYLSMQFYIVDCVSGDETLIVAPVGQVQECKTDVSREDFQNLTIDTTTLPRCFFVKVKLYDCFEHDCDVVGEHCTEPYEEVRCDYPTLLIEGTYTGDDCFGNHYGLTQNCPTRNQFRNLYRIPGELIHDGYDFVQTKTAQTNVSVTQRRRFTLLLPKLPPYVADRIAIAYGGQAFYIDGIAYEGNIKLDKNFEPGREWIIQSTLFIECDIDFGCEQ